MSDAPPVPVSAASSSDSLVALKFDARRSKRIAIGLRATALLLQIVQERDLLPDGELLGECVKRREQLDWLAGQFEAAVKEAAPELPRHERSKPNRKMVWCRGEGCERALTLEQARESELCPVCREAKPAA